MTEPQEVLNRYIDEHIGADLPDRPLGWPNDIEAALIDAIFSIQARYGGENNGVREVVRKWRQREGHSGPTDDLRTLEGTDPASFVDTVQNRSKASGRLKGEIVVEAAQRLADVGLVHAGDFSGSKEQKCAYLSVKGCGPVTWSYFGMLLGRPGVKADTWIVRFVEKALGRSVAPEEARQLIVAAAKKQGTDATQLDHAIWRYSRANL